MSSTRKPQWRGRAFYEEVLGRREREGLSYTALRSCGAPVSSLQRWGRRLAAERAASAGPRFVEVVADRGESSESRVEVLLCSGRTLSFPAGRPFEGLAELVTVLESC